MANSRSCSTVPYVYYAERKRLVLTERNCGQVAKGPVAEGTQASGQVEDETGETESIVTDLDLFKASDKAMDLMKEAIKGEETYKKVSGPVKDSSDKRGLIRRIKSPWQ